MSTPAFIQSPTSNPQQPIIRFGLSAIKNVGTNVVRAIIQEREKNGKFKSIEDFITRVDSKDLNKKSLESLIKCGALDQFGEREKLLANIDQFLNFKKIQKKNSLSRQTSLFGLLPEKESVPKLKLKDGPMIDKKTRLAWEKALLGLYVSEHPLKEMELYLENNITPIKKLDNRENFNNQYGVQIAGIITKIQKVFTRNNEPMLFVKVEDLTGSVEVLVFPNLLKTTGDLWQEDKIISIKGRLSDRDDILKILANDAEVINTKNIKTLEHKNPSTSSGYNIKTDQSASDQSPAFSDQLQIFLLSSISQKDMEKLKDLFAAHSGQTKVYLLFKDNGRFRKISTNFSVKADEKLTQEIKKIAGPDSIKMDKIG
jgi:DNA polymerase-3 subunit alpha